MNNKLSLALALLVGFLGGLFIHYIAPPAVFAQNAQPLVPVPPLVPPAITKEIRAQSFTLVDARDHAVGTFMVVAGRIVLRDPTGRDLWSVGGGAPVLPVSQR